nr:DedA family protein [Oleiagrimonas sp. C23AA]
MTAHAFWAGPLLALVAFAEGLAVVGSFVPGSIILFTIGTSAGAAHLNVTSMVVWATAGAWIGDTLSYWLGKRHGSRMLAMRPFAYKPQWTERARSLLERRGDIAVIVGRWVPPLRALIPLLAGMSRLGLVRFVLADFFACAVWAAAHLVSGALLGHSMTNGGVLQTLWDHLTH